MNHNNIDQRVTEIFHIPEFESTVAQNRDVAMQALQNVDDIEKKILQATTKTKESFEAMNGADTSANLALSVARDAQKVIFFYFSIPRSYVNMQFVEMTDS